jgi:hypothetical protein
MRRKEGNERKACYTYYSIILKDFPSIKKIVLDFVEMISLPRVKDKSHCQAIGSGETL